MAAEFTIFGIVDTQKDLPPQIRIVLPRMRPY
jgi:hypothetical protein